jgi:predicted dehydrogenase
MSENERDSLEYNRRDFLRGGSVATLMTMLGGVELIAQTTNEPAGTGPTKRIGPQVKVGVIGLGAWGREIVNTLARLDQAEVRADVAAICDTYPASIRRCAKDAPGASQTEDYKTILANKEIVLAALKAGKHVYCEAPLATTIEDAREIALAAKAAKQAVFQTGLQLRSDPQRRFLLPFIRSGCLGKTVMARAQWHKKQSWRTASPNPEREKALNWRLNKETSMGLVGEFGIHAIDDVGLFLNSHPVAVTGWGSVMFWSDGREVPDTIQAVLEFPEKVNMTYDATLANSFDSDYEMLFGSDAAIMMRESKAWMFKETDSPLLGWEVYASKQTFYKETGIALVANASKSVQAGAVKEEPFTNTQLSFALTNFLKNANELDAEAQQYKDGYGADDVEGLNKHLAEWPRRAAAGYLDGYHATVTAIKANESVLSGQRIVLKPEWYELG